MYRFRCADCGKRFELSEEEAGRDCACPSCGMVFEVPGTINISVKLITCSACDRKMRVHAEQCPHCGKKMAEMLKSVPVVYADETGGRFDFQCPDCKQEEKAGKSQLRKLAKCGGCGELYRVNPRECRVSGATEPVKAGGAGTRLKLWHLLILVIAISVLGLLFEQVYGTYKSTAIDWEAEEMKQPERLRAIRNAVEIGVISQKKWGGADENRSKVWVGRRFHLLTHEEKRAVSRAVYLYYSTERKDRRFIVDFKDVRTDEFIGSYGYGRGSLFLRFQEVDTIQDWLDI